MKFFVTADVDWVQGYLKYGHMEGTVEVESEEELEAMIESGTINDYLDLMVDDYRVEDYEDPDRYKWAKIEE